MNCEQLKTEVALLPILNAAEELQGEAAAHTQACASCRAYVEERIQLDSLLGLHPQLDVSEEWTKATLRRALDEVPATTSAQGGGRILSLLRSPLVLLAAAVLVMIMIKAYGPGKSGDDVIDPDPLLASLEATDVELLEDWELLQDFGEDIDLLAEEELLAAMNDLDDSLEGTPR